MPNSLLPVLLALLLAGTAAPGQEWERIPLDHRSFNSKLRESPQAVPAESDGYFCVGPDYLAYEVSSPGVSDTHRLVVIPFDPRKWTTRYVRELPEFHVRDMSCEDMHVRLVDESSIYDVTWVNNDPHPLELSTSAKEAESPNPDVREQPPNLIYGRDWRISFADPGSRISFGLETTRKNIQGLPCWELKTVWLSKIDYDLIDGPEILLSRELAKECVDQ